jgi:AcrR family transcriptional regulator
VSPRRRLPDARRVQILEAAARVIGQRGLSDTRISDIAERAGTSAPLVLYYFESKDRLLAEALTFAEERFYEETAAELAGIESARDRLVRLIELSCTVENSASDVWQDEYLLWLDLWARAPRDPEIAKSRQALDRRWRTTIADIVRAGQASGEFRAVDAEDFSLRFGALLDGLAIQVVLEDPDVPMERMREICLRTAATELGFALPGAGSGSLGAMRARVPKAAKLR